MKKNASNPKQARAGVELSAAAQSLAARLGLGSASGRSAGKKSRPTIVLTEKALAALRQREWMDGDFMRIGVVAGGCSGQTYSAAVDDELFITDLVLYESGPLRVVADPESATYLDGLQIDYSDDLIRSGFRFSNPNASGGCGCGASFKANP